MHLQSNWVNSTDRTWNKNALVSQHFIIFIWCRCFLFCFIVFGWISKNIIRSLSPLLLRTKCRFGWCVFFVFSSMVLLLLFLCVLVFFLHITIHFHIISSPILLVVWLQKTLILFHVLNYVVLWFTYLFFRMKVFFFFVTSSLHSFSRSTCVYCVLFVF